eukprot:SAG31_NODE_40684_length_279_cov_1.127778_1_plen_34_part_10
MSKLILILIEVPYSAATVHPAAAASLRPSDPREP